MNSENFDNEVDVSENELDILSMLIGDDEEKWRNTRGQIELINQFIQKGERPCDILKNFFKINMSHLPEDPLEQWSIILHLIMEGPHRKRLEDINTFTQACELIKSAKNIMVLTGAGISVPCGVPDFRSRNGIYARLAVDFPDLDEPQSMFDINYFIKNPRPFFKFAKEIYPGKFSPSIGHKFIKLLESKEKLLRNYTQNIDTLEQVAGIKNIIQCHGSFATATCMRCEYKMKGSEIEEDVLNQRIPICPQCTHDNEKSFEMLIKEATESDDELPLTKLPLMKPDVVFFGEGLPRDFHATLADDKNAADLLIVIGSSLKVRPVAHIPGCLPPNVPQILINKEPLSNHSFDVELLGDCDVIVRELCRQLGWTELALPGNYCEKTIFEMKSIIEAAIEVEGDEEVTVAEKEELTEAEGEKKDDSQLSHVKLINVSDLLNEGGLGEITCIRVPPNRYIFQGADYTIDIEDIENAESHVMHALNHSHSFTSCSSDEDDEEEEDEEEEGEEGDDEVGESSKLVDSPTNDCHSSPKRRRLSPTDE